MDLIRNINRRRVLDVIKHYQPVSRAVISRKLSLSRSTVSIIVNDLVVNHLVIEMGTGESTMNGGRKGTLLGFNPQSAFGVGVDLQIDHLRIILADLDGTIVSSHTFSWNHELREFKLILREFLNSLSAKQTNLMGIGISVPSIVKDHEIVVDAPSLGWQNLNLAEELSDVTEFSAFAINDVNAAAFGEWWVGQSRLIDNLFYLYIGAGVGSAIMANGEWVSGADQAAGEIGYTLEKSDVDKHETYVVGRFGTFEKKITSLLAANKLTPDNLEQLVTELSVAFANVSSLLNPEKIIIGGSYEQVLMPLIEQIQERVNRYSPLPAEIVCATLGENASVIGSVGGLYRYLREQEIN